MQRSTDRILTTHVGSLARPHPLLELMKAQVQGRAYDEEAFAGLARQAVADVVRRQAGCGIDVVSDGEQSKAGFYGYVQERLSGLEIDENGVSERAVAREELEQFPEYYKQYLGGKAETMVRNPPLVCTGPITYTGEAAVQADIANLRAALGDVQVVEAFMPAIAPRAIGRNQFYASGEDFLVAMAEAMRQEYLAIVEAGFILQIDDPMLTALYYDDPFGLGPRGHVDILNHALRGIPEDRIRYHTCYGINEGPRIHDVPLQDLTDLLFQIHAQAISFEAVNPRHQHEWHVWEDVKLPDDKLLIPGMISHATNIVEHPQLIADLLATYGRLVGRENVIAGADCGFSSTATFSPEIDPKVVWAKFQALSEGARIASERLWGPG
ncbi:MAG: cobalamin-independent methionine synthase II family protein [Chloroflexi bacterium]|nr:cobalamin-independent methionine synthase II family protein [Chloroflexota bacterium]